MKRSIVLFVLTGCGGSGAPPSVVAVPVSTPGSPASDTPSPMSHYSEIVNAPDRSDADRDTDARRKPAEMLAFADVKPGMRVADIGAGTGYTSELLARAVGSEGEVIGHNTPYVLQRFAEAGWSERLRKPVMSVVRRVDRPFDDPFGPDVRGLDVVINVLFYHDFEWQGIDRAAHNRAVFEALAPGGAYVVIDAHAAEGAGATGSKTLHRIERSLVIEEVAQAGFELADEADFLRNPADTRDWNALPWSSGRDEYSDKFVLRFERPRA